MSKWRLALLLVAIVAVILSLINASWIAPAPKGRLKLIAHRGVAQQFSRAGIDDATCTATRIAPPEHKFIENSVYSMHQAAALGADLIELDVQPTRDGRMVVFHDATLDCRTDGTGAVRDHDLAALKKLDIGHGYTADGGRTFPLRGRGIGAMPTVEEVLGSVRTPLLFHFKGTDPREADLLAAAFRRAGVPIGEAHGFYGDERVLARMRAIAPGAWTFSKERARACLADYVKTGWTSIVPESCRGTTVAVPLNYQWAVWGWPKRFLARMDAVGARVILFGDYEDGVAAGIERPEQLADVPRGFTGYLWVEDMYNVGRALGR
jgi:glycerophosphoryl diester phosphodiesterase